jgi:hypothetical protein
MTNAEKAALYVGAALLLLAWPKGRVSTSGGTLSRDTLSPDAYTPGTEANRRLTAAQDAWYLQHPDEPFVNDDGTVNLLPGYTL